MSKEQKTLRSVLLVSEAGQLQEVIDRKCHSPALNQMINPEVVMRFMRANLCGSYLFARFAVPSYAAAVFASLTTHHPVDNTLGPLVAEIVETVRGELFNNNIFCRPGECHSHYLDALEAYEAAGGDMEAVARFVELEGVCEFDVAIRQSALWTDGSVRFARNLFRCCADPLALFIMMPANEVLTPMIYAKVLGSLSRDGRFDKFRRFLERHVQLDSDDHGPTVLEWLDVYIRRTGHTHAQIRESTEKVLALFAGTWPHA